MILALRIFFAVVLASMLLVTSWAGLQVPLWEVPRAVGAHPWFIATLCDAYWGFFTFWAWLCYKETSAGARLLWFVAIMLLGNIAMASYGLAVTLQTPRHSPVQAVLLRGQPVRAALPAALLLGLGLVGAFTAIT